jgi:transcriptional regulator with XRE-family HTH domain
MGNNGYDGAANRLDDDNGSGVVAAFGRQLKLLRMRAGTDRAEFGALMGYAAQSVASFEQGRRIPSGEFIDRADEVLDAGGVLKALKEEVLRAQYPSFFRDAARLEAKAESMCVYALYAVPGLLQTEDYARAGFRLERPLLDDEVIDERLAARMARQPTDREKHAALGGPFNLIDTAQGQRIAYAEVQGDSRLYTGRQPVRELEARYGILRSQALTPRESLLFIEKLLGER